MNNEPGVCGELAGEVTPDLRDVDQRRALVRARLGDLHRLAVDGGLDMPFDDDHVAIGDFHALELDVDADAKTALDGRTGG